MTSQDWTHIPAPADDGGADHLAGRKLPQVGLVATNGQEIDLSALSGLMVIYIYPMTAQPGTDTPEGWEMIPGALGCTPQSCAFREHYSELQDLGVDHLFGLSVQDTDWQREAKERLKLPFELLSDKDMAFGHALELPMFSAGGMSLFKRITLIVRDGVIEDTLYPVFPPDQNAEIVVERLKTR